MKSIEVVAAVIVSNGRILATERGYGQYKGWWEFPGGKVEPGESLHNALHREISEELDAEIKIESHIDTIEWDYPDFHLTLHCFLCTLLSETYRMNEHTSARWLTAAELNSVHWLPADITLLPTIASLLPLPTPPPIKP